MALREPVPPGALGFSEFVAQAPPGARADSKPAPASEHDPCHIMFTSGTTGRPKGVVLKHAPVCRAYRSWASVIGLRHDDRYLIINPFFHSFGLNAGILACLMTGATMVPHPVFDVPSVMARVPQERISMLPGPPAIYQTILNHPDLDSFDMSTLRLAVTGAAPVPVPMIEAMRERLGFEVVVTGYGLTESSGIATMCRHDDPPETISATSGRAIDDVEVRVVGPDGAELRPGEPGEIVVRGYNVMDGYLDDPEATAAAVDAAGWLHTGDIGTMDAAGYVAITDRLKDMFICGGFNAYPAEIEADNAGAPRGGSGGGGGPARRPPGRGGPRLRGARSGRRCRPRSAGAELVTWCRERMANYKAPARHHLRHRAAAQRVGQGAQAGAARSNLSGAAAAPKSLWLRTLQVANHRDFGVWGRRSLCRPAPMVGRVQVERLADVLVGQPGAELFGGWRRTEMEHGPKSCRPILGAGPRAGRIALNLLRGVPGTDEGLGRPQVPRVARLEVGAAVPSPAVVGGDPGRRGRRWQSQEHHDGDQECVHHFYSPFLLAFQSDLP